MSRNIDIDLQRFKHIVRGKVRQNLRKYINHGDMMGRKGKETVSIPVSNIDIPHFRHGKKGSGGTGQGEGEVGQPVGQGDDPADGQGQAGDKPGQHVREVELTFEELAAMLANELQLPNIIPKGQETIKTSKDKYTSINRTGPDALRHFKRTYKQALKRQIATGDYNSAEPKILPTKDDERFKSWKTVTQPEANAAIVYMMDVSGSMTDDQKEIVRIEAFWIDTWLKSQYRGIQRRYIVHDVVAHEVDEDTFFRVKESGGTRISSAYRGALKVIERDFPLDDWNLYCFQFSDGDNWGEDNIECLKMLTTDLLPKCNLFCYGQVDSPYGSGDYLRELKKVESKFDSLILSEIASKDGIYDSIKTFLGKGK